MKISIIIPTYNHCDLLSKCINSIQKYTDFTDKELVIVANGCTDGTKEYLETLPKYCKHSWFNEPIGYTKAVNEGIKFASGEFVLPLNNDVEVCQLAHEPIDLWTNELMRPFLNDDKVGITGPTKFTLRLGEVKKTCMAFWCVLFRKNLINQIGFLDEIFSPGMGEDMDFSIKAEMLGYKLVQVPYDPSPDDPAIEYSLVHTPGEHIEYSFKSAWGQPYYNFPLIHLGSSTFNAVKDKDYIMERNIKVLMSRVTSLYCR